jgi:hypothetical protein
MIRLQADLQRAARELGLRIVTQCVLDLRPGRQIQAVAILPQLGAPEGMVIFEHFEELAGLGHELTEAGFGYCVLSDPLPSEAFDLNSFIEMFSDWGWAATGETRPDWMK